MEKCTSLVSFVQTIITSKASLHPYSVYLSPAEARLLTLSKLDLDTRQMSRVPGIAPESIRKTRCRLRKRLGIDGASPLSALPGESAG